jgi:hypothetical protein
MVSVDDEVRATHLIHADRRKVAGGKRLPERLELRRDLVARPEVAIEVDRPVERADDSLDGDLAPAEIGLLGKSQPALDLGVRTRSGP